jgi:hypothetical protein
LALAACGGKREPAEGGESFATPAATFDGACVQATLQARPLPLAMHLLVDQSASMGDATAGGTKWSIVVSALDAFLTSPGAAGASVGLQYFAVPASALQGSQPVASCDPAVYAEPDVEIGPLPDSAPALEASLAAHFPWSTSPMQPALQGAVAHAVAWGAAHPGATPVVVLVTDGDPSGCDSTVAGTVSIAATADRDAPAIPVFVIGIGASGSNLDAIAAGGGTGRAFYVDAQGAVGDDFRAALDAVQRSHAACRYDLPRAEAGTLDLDRVNIAYGPASGSTRTVVGNVSGPSACAPGSDGSDGWYYDPPDDPRAIVLCPDTCAAVAGPETTVAVALGCATQPAMPR